MTKILIIISGDFFETEHVECIKILDDYMKQNGTIEYCGIASHDHFSVFEDTIQFKYKMINNKKQLSKFCDFISEYKEKLDYDWYIKIRPDMKLLENISFDLLSTDAINSRARIYYGPKKIKYGNSVGGEGPWKNRGNDFFPSVEDNGEEYICPDDGLFIFHKNIIETCAFDTLPITDWSVSEDEKFHRNWFLHRGIKMNVIGINLCNTKYNQYSGDF
jgi:hypothetical protein